ncbi:hypothetical protein SAMD00019534_039080 [Acytostelium subglobosum LB1]|uniref:hypothetical protein n=1 Tax=Acytostelium subglobosum LB1 TaxID=1410327 RepID=UPI00064503C4|nr:hypothetical protein SAMD00019534_039080 [Acytostelium subglobosum LB1]GAM20733.1 hypothetical protein SAMD00019534_039080 [Acytostelium subglobosum LB1]|eukprot:XP_012755867.1 hypothetical protein SAMD00019534_039080 [Acytostelium subglobosum LB1]
MSSRYSDNGSSSSQEARAMERAPLMAPHPPKANQLSIRTTSNNARNINIMVLTVFLSSIGFTLMMPSMYGYLNSVNPKYGDRYNGWATAIYSFGQFVASPVFGYWGNRRPTIEPVVFSLVIALIGNALYATCSSFGQAFIPMIFLARFLVGVGAGNVAVCRAFASEKSDISNKTQVMGKMSGAQGAGFVLGPALGFGLTYVHFYIGSLPVSKFTSPGYVSVLLGIVNIIFVVIFFRDQPSSVTPISSPVVQSINSVQDEEVVAIKKPEGPEEDRLAVYISIYLFAVVISIFAVFESIMAMMTDKYYGWGPRANGLLMGCSGVLSLVVFFAISTPLIKKFQDRKMALFGFFNLFIALLFLASYDNGPFNWEKGLPKWQLFIGAVFVSIGYPISSSMMYAIFAKILSPKQQGTKMGWLTSGGSLARMLGPLWATALFVDVADDVLYLTCAGLTASAFIVLCIFYKRLAPHSDYINAQIQKDQQQQQQDDMSHDDDYNDYIENYNTTPHGGSIYVRDDDLSISQ